jgi:L-threonylcarbamoyladenylate synthase
MVSRGRAALDPTTDVERAAAAILAGGLVAIPTETVYGLAADATNPGAVARIFEVKGRPIGHPLIVHIGDVTELDDWSDGPPPMHDGWRYWRGRGR